MPQIFHLYRVEDDLQIDGKLMVVIRVPRGLFEVINEQRNASNSPCIDIGLSEPHAVYW